MEHMNTGNGELSYSQNSLLQEIVIQKGVPVLKDTIKSMVEMMVFGKCLKMADLGCSSGKNTLLVARTVIDIVDEVCKEKNNGLASASGVDFEVLLNDLYGNDFNALFKLLPDFHAKLRKEKGEDFGGCFVSAVPGSFYGRLFPDKTLHLVHSSYSVHWLSQHAIYGSKRTQPSGKVPKGLDNNKTNIYMARTSPPSVLEAYRNQFYSDFAKFLEARSKELVTGGRMVLIFRGRSIVDPTVDDCCRLFELLAQSLVDMVKEGLVRESDINSFNLPCYTPCEDEVRNVIRIEGSFSVDTLDVFQGNWDPYDTDFTNSNDSKENSHIHGKNIAQVIRVVMEPLLTSHFGSSIIDVLFKKFEKYVSEDLVIKKTRNFNVLVSLAKK